MRTLIYITTIAYLCVALTSCGNKQVYSQYNSINNHTWQVDSVANFAFTITDTVNKHNVLLGVRNGTEYSYSNIFLFVKTTFPNKKTINDTVEILLADTQGKWLGKTVNNLIDNQILYKRGILFPLKGNYTMSVQQGMRDAKLAQLFDVGVTINQSEK
ncbi:MAG: gliding motility lipoprotein GldH [Bacteroidia bacterium]